MKLKTPLSVGFVVLVAICGLVYFLVGMGGSPFKDSATYPLTADFTDVSGIRLKTRVTIGGLDAGRIARIAHTHDDRGRLVARVTLRISKEYDVYADAHLQKVAESLLGDFRLELDPGTPGGRPLPEGASIMQVKSLSDIDEIKGQLVQVARNVNAITESFSQVLGGKSGQGSIQSIMSKVENSMAAIEATTSSLKGAIADNDAVLRGIILDAGHVSRALALLTAPGGDVTAVGHNLARISGKLDQMVDTVQDLLGGSQDGPHDAQADAGSVKDDLRHLGDTLENLSDITRKVDEGQGTLGRIINDPGIAERVEETLTSANTIIGSIAGLETQIELRSEYDVPFAGTNQQIQPAIKNTLALRIFPKPDKYYILEAVSDPRGRQTRSLTTTSVNGTSFVTDETSISFSELKFSAEFAKRYYFTTLRFGIIENTGGLGINFHLFDEHAEIRLDAFDFSRRNPSDLATVFPRLRATGMYEIVRHLSLQGGVDDPFNRDLRAWFLGGVMRFTDDDLRAFLAISPKI